MPPSVSVQEHTHYFWKYATYFCGILCLILFLMFWNINIAFWSSIFRFSSFIFFSLTVLGYLKIMDGPLTVNLSRLDNQLILTYEKKGSVIQEEQFDRSTVKEVVPATDHQNFINVYLQPDSAALKIHFTDTDRELFLFEFGGRPLYFDQSALQQIQNFLEDNKIKTTLVNSDR